MLSKRKIVSNINLTQIHKLLKGSILLLTQHILMFRRTNILIKDIKIVIRFFSYFILIFDLMRKLYIYNACIYIHSIIRITIRCRLITYISGCLSIFKDLSQTPLPHILKLLTFRMFSGTIHTIIRHYF